MWRATLAASAALLTLAMSATPAAAQAWVPGAGYGSVTFTTQAIDHLGHILNDGTLIADGKSTTIALDLAADYALTDRLSFSVDVPYVFAKYRGPGPSPPFVPFLPVDSCFCFHSGLQDLTITTRYNLINRRRGFALTPSMSVGLPSRDYDHVGEAVVGRDLKELRIAVDAGQRFSALSGRLSLQGRYSYAFVERVLSIPNNRSNGSIEGRIAMTRRLSISGLVTWQRTHGGLRFPDDVVVSTERILEHDRLLRDNSLRMGGGASYSWGQWNVSASLVGYTHGSNTHALRAITVDIGRAFQKD